MKHNDMETQRKGKSKCRLGKWKDKKMKGKNDDAKGMTNEWKEKQM